MKELSADEVGFPRITFEPAEDSQVFSLSSHARARDALEFGLSIRDPGFNIFVLGDDRTGRMSATLNYLNESLRDWTPADDWVYLNNFSEPHRPSPFSLPLGTGRPFAARMNDLIPRLREALTRAFSNEPYQRQLQERHEATQEKVSEALDTLRKEARNLGLDILQTPQGLNVAAIGPDGQPLSLEQIPDERRKDLEAKSKDITAKLREINRKASKEQSAFASWVQEYNKKVADNAVGNLLDDLAEEYKWHKGLSSWIGEMRADLIENLQIFLPQQGQETAETIAVPERRYAVNVLVDRCGEEHARVVLEPHPTPENLFGRIEYQQAGGVLMTDFTLIRPGALHKANGGVLILRAEALAAAPGVWSHLKAALRDGEIPIESRQMSSPVPLASAPHPHPVPLDLKIVIVGAPRWYYTFFSVDPQFQTFFRVKADVDSDMEATPENLACFAGLIEKMADCKGGIACNRDAMGFLLGIASRWAGHRDKLTARFELIEDTLREAAHFLGPKGPRDPSGYFRGNRHD
jgi:predicted ATP-dependent protease